MGSGSGAQSPGSYSTKHFWSIHAAILPHLELAPLFNSINFCWGTFTDDVPLSLTTIINLTATQTQVNTFLCPSDYNATASFDVNAHTANNDYFGCIGATTNTLGGLAVGAASLASVPYSGLFAFQQSKTIASITDGTSNTVAFAESTVGTPAGYQAKGIGLINVPGIPAAALQFTALADPADVLAGIAVCSTAWNSGAAAGPNIVSDQRGDSWTEGAMGLTLFNTVVTPNGVNQNWTYCAGTSSCVYANFSNSDSYHPGGVNVLMADGHVAFIKNTINQYNLVGPGDDRRGRGPQQRQLLKSANTGLDEAPRALHRFVDQARAQARGGRRIARHVKDGSGAVTEHMSQAARAILQMSHA